MNILQIGLGGFGKNHLRAWHALGLGEKLHVAELDRLRWSTAAEYRVPVDRLGTDYRAFLAAADIVDIVTPSTNHYAIALDAISAGKDVFIEKPMTMTSVEAEELARSASAAGRLVQVGYYYRFHPAAVALRDACRSGRLGTLRYLSGAFLGFKRARTDVGVTHTDAIHFLDLFNWIVGEPPDEVFAVVRDHFGRGMEDLSIVLLTYPGRLCAKVESGYIQPGRWRDKVVAGAFTTKEVFLCGDRATAEVDFETERLVLHDVHHELRQGIWTAVHGGNAEPPTSTATPVEMVAAELRDFLDCVRSRRRPGPNAVASGVVLARQMEAIYTSADRGTPQRMSWSSDERGAFETSDLEVQS